MLYALILHPHLVAVTIGLTVESFHYSFVSIVYVVIVIVCAWNTPLKCLACGLRADAASFALVAVFPDAWLRQFLLM
jgi:hypothetical protein